MMSSQQDDLFGTPEPPPPPPPSPEIVAMVRARLLASLDSVKAAPPMPWKDMLGCINIDNDFRHGRKYLPKEEGDALWAEFDVEMDRLYAIMNEGKEMPDY